MRRASFWFTATTVDTVPTATHNTTLSPASRALERGRSVRGYPTHVSDPLSSFGHAVWRFLKVAPAGRYAALDLSDRIGADSCPCAFHWLQHLLGQPRLSENFSRGASRGPLIFKIAIITFSANIAPPALRARAVGSGSVECG